MTLRVTEGEGGDESKVEVVRVRIRSSHYDDVPAHLTVHDPSYQRLSSAGDKMAFIVDKIVALWPWKVQVIMSQFVRGEKKTWGG